MITPRWIVGFSGHRGISDEAAVRKAFGEVLDRLESRAKGQGTLELYASAAYGSDIIAIEGARERGMPVHVALPLSEAEFRRDFQDDAQWERSRKAIAWAREHTGGVASFRVVRGATQRPDCYYDAGLHVLDGSDVFVVVWDGKAARGLGGTGDVVEQARRMKKPMVWIHAETFEITEDNLPPSWPPADAVIVDLNRLAAVPSGKIVPQARDAASLAGALSEIARANAPRFRLRVITAIVLHAVAAIIAAFVLAGLVRGILPPGWVSHVELGLGLVELLMVAAALFIIIRLKRAQTQTRWLRARFATELLRGLRTVQPMIDPLHPQVSRHDPAWNRFAIVAGLLARAEWSPAEDLESFKARYLKERLEGQRSHFLSRAAPAATLYHVTNFVAVWASRLAPAFVLIAVLVKMAHQPWVPDWFPGVHELATVEKDRFGGVVLAVLASFMPVVLPLCAGTATALRAALDSPRRAHRYPEMAARLDAVARRFPDLRTPTSVARAVARTEEMLLDELIEWRLVAEHTGAH